MLVLVLLLVLVPPYVPPFCAKHGASARPVRVRGRIDRCASAWFDALMDLRNIQTIEH